MMTEGNVYFLLTHDTVTLNIRSNKKIRGYNGGFNEKNHTNNSLESYDHRDSFIGSDIENRLY